MNPLWHSRRACAALVMAGTAVVVVVAGCSSSGSAGPASSPATSAAATGLTAENTYPVSIQAANGDVTIEHRPTAIVSLSPTATEDLFAIGAGSQVKAVDKNSDYPASAPHTKLDAYQLDVESLAGYQPDLVVASNLTAAQLKQLKTLGIPTLLEPAPVDLSGAYDQMTELGLATGHVAEAAAEVDKLKRQVRSIVGGSPHQPATYYYELDQTYYSETSATFIGRVLKLLGLTSIADQAKGVAASGGYPQLSAEFILNANPDYVLLADTLCCRQSAAAVAKRPGWSALGAVTGGRIVALNDDVASRWGPRVVDLLRTVADALRQHPVH